MAIELTTRTETYRFEVLRRDRPFFAERLAMFLPCQLSEAAAVKELQLTCTAYACAEAGEVAPPTFEHWCLVLNGDSEKSRIEGHILHLVRSRRLVPVAKNTAVAVLGCEALGLVNPSSDARPPFVPALVDLWTAIGWPAFEGVTILRAGTDVPAEVYKEDDHRKTFAAYDRNTRISEGNATCPTLYAARGSGTKRTVETVVLTPWPELELLERHRQFDWPEQHHSPTLLGGNFPRWETQFPEMVEQPETTCRHQVLDKTRNNRLINADLPMEGLKGDLEGVKAAAFANYKERRDLNSWQALLPPLNEEMRGQAECLVAYVNDFCLDLHIPEGALNAPTEGAHPVVTARLRKVPFYDGYDLVEVTEHVGGRARKTEFLWAADPDKVPTAEGIPKTHEAFDVAARKAHLVTQLIGLDQSSDIFHALNAMFRGNSRFEITPELAPSFVEFFCSYVHGEDGAFKVVEDPDEVEWRGFYHRQREVAKRTIHPLRVWPKFEGTLDQGALIKVDIEAAHWVEATVIYGNALFRCLFAVDPCGNIGMNSDEPLLIDFPVRSFKWSTKTRFLLSTFPETS